MLAVVVMMGMMMMMMMMMNMQLGGPFSASPMTAPLMGDDR